MFGSGMAALVAHRHMSDSVFELATVLIGAFLIASAHILNLRYSKQCECCKSASDLHIPEILENPNRGNQ
jgi:hypothetical protein